MCLSMAVPHSYCTSFFENKSDKNIFYFNENTSYNSYKFYTLIIDRTFESTKISIHWIEICIDTLILCITIE